MYAIGFGSFASEVLGLFISENSFDVGNPYANVIIKCEYIYLSLSLGIPLSEKMHYSVGYYRQGLDFTSPAIYPEGEASLIT